MVMVLVVSLPKTEAGFERVSAAMLAKKLNRSVNMIFRVTNTQRCATRKTVATRVEGERPTCVYVYLVYPFGHVERIVLMSPSQWQRTTAINFNCQTRGCAQCNSLRMLLCTRSDFPSLCSLRVVAYRKTVAAMCYKNIYSKNAHNTHAPQIVRKVRT